MDTMIETTFTFRNTQATDPLRDHTEEKLERLYKYLFKPAQAHCILKVEGARHIVEITLNANGSRFVGTETSTDMYTSIDSAVDKIRKQLSRVKERAKGHKGE